ncbi:MAG: SpoIIE family protein phosphatase, partial [Ruminococcus sp.]|nr:SpoIIE family protein phosphatase [Ruminococcus sp.]
ANRLIAELYFTGGSIPASTSRICDLVSDELGLELREATTAATADDYRVSLYEPPEYSIEVYSASVCADGSEVSGDSTVLFTDSEGVSYAALSDGMGTGKSAAVDSHMVIGLFRRLICGGMECGAAVKLINSVMVSKSRDESFATFDAVRFDPDTAFLTSVKSGAAATLIRQSGNIIKVSAPTFPIGINETAEVSTSCFQLGDNDMVIMFSDGISENEYLFIKELLLSGDDIQEIVRETAVKASSFAHSPHSDDVTVIGVKIISNS